MSQIRTPPSLKWLINKRARLLGEVSRYENAHSERIAKAKKEVEDAESALALAKHQLEYEESVTPKLVSVLRADLIAIDSVLGLHEIHIDPDVIPEIRSQHETRLLPHGELTKLIYECLKHADTHPVSTTEIAIFISTRMNLENTEEVFHALRNSVKDRLRKLCSTGGVERLHPPKTTFEGRWKLK